MRACAPRHAAHRLLRAWEASGAGIGAARLGEAHAGGRAGCEGGQPGGAAASGPAECGLAASARLGSRGMLSWGRSSACEPGATSASRRAEDDAGEAPAAARSADRRGPGTCSGSGAPQPQPAAQAPEAWGGAVRSHARGAGRRVIAVGLSGGVDSAVAAMLLKQQGCACRLPGQLRAGPHVTASATSVFLLQNVTNSGHPSLKHNVYISWTGCIIMLGSVRMSVSAIINPLVSKLLDRTQA